MKQRLRMPASAVDWLLSQPAPRAGRLDVLLLGTSKSQIRDLLFRGHQVWVNSPQYDKLARLSGLSDGGFVQQSDQPSPRPRLVAGAADALPMHDCRVDVAFLMNPALAATKSVTAELARVLRPGGWACGARMVRDDTVPWVRRFIELMLSVDPSAMQAIGPDPIFETITASKKFPAAEQRGFRIWTEISKPALIAMATNSVAEPKHASIELAALEQQVGQLYDDAAGPSGLRLPYQLQCWRAGVDHSELTSPIRLSDDGLRIPI